MNRVIPLAEHISPDTIGRLERAAEARFTDAERLLPTRMLAAIYLLGYSVEMCLTAAYFRGAGFQVNFMIDRDTRQRRMAQARQLRTATGGPLMDNDPHPLVGWARFLQWQRSASGALSRKAQQNLQEAIRLAEAVYRHWRPELRYKNTDVRPAQLDEVRRAARWFLELRAQL